jgi:hypothetical protein
LHDQGRIQPIDHKMNAELGSVAGPGQFCHLLDILLAEKELLNFIRYKWFI